MGLRDKMNDNIGLYQYKFKTFIQSLARIIYLNIGGQRNTLKVVEKCYDTVKDEDIILKDIKSWGYRNGKQVYDYNLKFQSEQIEEYIHLIKIFEFKNILEVGAGELAVFRGMFQKPDFNEIKYYAVDISQNRVDIGKRKFPQCQYKKASATNLPFKDKQFDIVITSHCIEQIKYDYKKAIDECLRVGKVVIFFEPSYELGGIIQKLRILAQDYVKGIPHYLDKRKVKYLSKLMNNCSNVHNRTAYHICYYF